MAEKREPTLAEMIDAGAYFGSFPAQTKLVSSNIRRARRFVLDDGAVDVISAVRRDYFAAPVFQYARAPFDDAPVWVEYDHHARLRGTGTPLMTGHSQRSGFLVLPAPAEGLIRVVSVWSDRRTAFSPVFNLLYNIEGGFSRRSPEIGDERHQWTVARLLGFSSVANPYDIPVQCKNLCDNINIEIPDNRFNSKDDSAAVLGSIVEESAGDLGFLTSALALINHGLVNYRDRPRPAGQRVLNGKLRPYMSDSVVSVCIPGKLSPIGALKQAHRAEQARKRAHEVRGHFRHYSDGRVVWIKSHQRGDASLGFVRQRYEVHATEH